MFCSPGGLRVDLRSDCLLELDLDPAVVCRRHANLFREISDEVLQALLMQATIVTDGMLVTIVNAALDLDVLDERAHTSSTFFTKKSIT